MKSQIVSNGLPGREKAWRRNRRGCVRRRQRPAEAREEGRESQEGQERQAAAEGSGDQLAP